MRLRWVPGWRHPATCVLAVSVMLASPAAPAVAQHGDAPAEDAAGDHGAGDHGAGDHGAEAPHGDGLAGEAEAYPEAVHHEPVGVIDVLTSRSFLATVINFAIFVFLLVRYAGGPIGRFFQGRSSEVAQELEEAKRLTEEANAKKAEYEERLAKLDRELDDLKAEMVRSGEKERDRMVAEAKERAERMRRDAEFAIDQRVRALRAELTRDTVQAALAKATAILEAQMTTDDQTRLADAYLETLSSKASEAFGDSEPGRTAS